MNYKKNLILSDNKMKIKHMLLKNWNYPSRNLKISCIFPRRLYMIILPMQVMIKK